MATEVGSLVYNLDIDDKNLKTQLDQADKHVNKFGDSVATLGKTLAGVFAVTKIVDFGKRSLDAFRESEIATARLSQALEATGRSSEFTVDQLSDMASALEKNSTFTDEAVMNTQALLLGFSSLGKDLLPGATQGIVDLAASMGTDLQSATTQVGKALQDPILGMTSLRRSGVSFSEEQQEVIKKMVETGDVAGAQRMLLEALAGENGFGGAAKAMSDAAGPMEKLHDLFENLQEIVGSFIMKLFTFGEWLSEHKIVLAVFGGMIAAVVVPAFIAWAVAAGAAAIATIALALPVLAIGAAIGTVAYLIMTNWDTIKNAFAAGVEFITNAIGAVIDWFSKVPETVGGIVNAVVGWFSDLPGRIGGVIKDIGTVITAPFRAAFNLVSGFWNDTVGKLSFNLPDWIPGIGGKGFSMPQLPILDNGGIVTSPTVAMLAANSKPEVVIPLDKLGSMGGTTVNIGQVNSQSDADYIFNRLDRRQQRLAMGMSG